MKKLLIAVDAPGPSEFIKPVIPLLQENFEIIIAAAHDSAEEILKSYGAKRILSGEEAEKKYSIWKPDALLTAVSSLRGASQVIGRFTELTKKEKRLVICFQDYWANHRWYKKQTLEYWDAILVPDELAERFLKEDGYKGNIFITGNPSFDRFRDFDTRAARLQVRKELHISEQSFVVFWSGQGTPRAWQAEEESFRAFAKGFHKLKATHPEATAIVHAHPRDEDPERYERIAPDLGAHDTTVTRLSNRLLPAADAIFAMYSTNLVHACFLRIPPVSVLLPDAGKKMLEMIGLSDFPPTTLGAAVSIYNDNPDEFKNLLTRIMNDQDFCASIKTNQEKYFPIPKEPAAERVAQSINKVLSVLPHGIEP